MMTLQEWERTGKPEITESDVLLKTAIGEDLEAIGKIKVRGYLDGQRVEFEAMLAEDVQRCLLSGIMLRAALAGDGSYIEKDNKQLCLSRDGKRDAANFTIYRKAKQANVVTVKSLQRERSLR